MSDENKKDGPKVQADNNSIAVGGISAGGDISGNIHIGNVYQTPEDDLPLSSDEIENGLTRFAQYLPERAPVLQDSFSSIAKKLRATLGADQNSLSPALKSQREDGVNRMKLMCMEVTDISFRAICLGQNPPPYDSRPPFLGLFAFRPEDREFFFGRDALVQKLVARIKAHPFLAVLGASGSGKSSLVMAGLVPALEAQMSYLTPSSAPLSQLLAAKESASAKTVFVIDQFEELFTHPHDSADRADFIQALLEITKTNRVVITMRADFWGEVAIYTDLKQAMQEHQELIAPMNVNELHSAMEKQAAVIGLRFDPTLSESILAEVKGEPGAMPLLQHALWELWNRRHGLWIKAEEYQAFGGVKQAIASTAEEVYASCSDFERARVRDIFLRLTRLDESGEGRDTRRRVLIEELIPVNSDSTVIINLLNKLADARLIVKTDKDVEVAHEALIRHWSRLTEWLNEDRDNLRLREGVSESAREWEDSKRDDSLLNHRGGRLELVLAMSKLPRYLLNPIEQAYLNACVKIIEKAIEEKQMQLKRENELKEAKTRAELDKVKTELIAQKNIAKRNIGLALAILLISIILAYPGIHGYWLKRRAETTGELMKIDGGPVELGNQKYFQNGQAIEPKKYQISTFWMEKYEVTYERYSFCIKAGECSPPNAYLSLEDDPSLLQKPIANISAIQADQFCAWIDRRLPAEAEWERAARYTDGRPWPWGEIEPTSNEYAILDHGTGSCFSSNACATNSVGTANKGKSEEEVYDLIGNVAEFTCTPYSSTNPQICAQPEDWNSEGFRLALRGFGADMQIDNSNAAYIRELVDPLYSESSFIGFRCVKDINP